MIVKVVRLTWWERYNSESSKAYPGEKGVIVNVVKLTLVGKV